MLTRALKDPYRERYNAMDGPAFGWPATNVCNPFCKDRGPAEQ